MQPEIVPATAELLDRFYGPEPRGPTVRGYVALLDGEPIGVAGVTCGQIPLVFSDLTPEMKRYPVLLFKTAKRILRSIRGTAYAVCNQDEPTAEEFLTRLGFERYDDDGVFVWHN